MLIYELYYSINYKYVGLSNNLNIKTDHENILSDENHPKYNDYLYQHMRSNNTNLDKWDFRILEIVLSSDEKFISQKLEYHINKIRPLLNKKIKPVKHDKEYHRKYYLRNKERMKNNTKRTVNKLDRIIQCEVCKATIKVRSIPNHKKSKMHLSYLEK